MAKKNKKEAEGFDDSFGDLLAETFDAASKTSRIPKGVKGGKGEENNKISSPEKKEQLVKERKPEKEESTKTEETENKDGAISIVTKSAIEAPVITKKENENIADEVNEMAPVVNIQPKEEIIHESSSPTSDGEGNKRDFKIDNFFAEYGADCYAHVHTRISDRDFIRIIARFENININVLTDNIIQAWLNKYSKYFEEAGYLGFMEVRKDFETENALKENPFSSKRNTKGRNTTMRVSYESAECMRHITTIENIPIFKTLGDSIYWWKKLYAPVLRKRNYFNFIKDFMKDVD